MAFITREYYENLKKHKLIEHGDWSKLAQLSKTAKMKAGKGYTARTFKNAVIEGFTTTDDVVELIVGYYTPKAEAVAAQRKAAKNIKMTLEAK